MDHLILPEGVEPYITVPYRCTEHYDDGDFLTYPERKGWTREHLLGEENFGGRSSAEVEAFFQTWLYFGCLLEILKAAGVQTKAQDFIDDGDELPVVTTKKLSHMLRKWKRRWPKLEVSPSCCCKRYRDIVAKGCGQEPCWKNIDHARHSTAYQTTMTILDEVCRFIDRYCAIDRREYQARQTVITQKSWPVAKEISISIAALGYTLRAAADHIFNSLLSERSNNWSGAGLLKERLLQANWCPKQVSKIMREFAIDGIYYVAARPHKEELIHSICTERACAAESLLNEKQYIMKHVTDGCCCQSVAPSEADVLEIICWGGTPIVTWARLTEDDEYQLIVTDFTDKRIPIPPMLIVQPEDSNKSRLFPLPPRADFSTIANRSMPMKRARRGSFDSFIGPTAPLCRGMGIPSLSYAPKLPEQLMHPPTPHVMTRYVAISHVWSDGMGNPTGNSLPKCQLARIQQMVDELDFPDHGSDKHISFWMDTLCIPINNPHERKLCIARMANIYAQATAVLVLDSGLEIISAPPVAERCIRILQCSWQRRLWTFQEGILATELYHRFKDGSYRMRDFQTERDKYQKKLRSRGRYISFLGLNAAGVDACISFAQFTQMHIKLGVLFNDSPWEGYVPLIEALRYRTTSRESDETLCAATILSIDPTELLELPEKAGRNLAERRMELFLQYIGRFPRSLIFNRFPRLQRDGFRWAPRSLMGSHPNDISDIEEEEKEKYAMFYKSGHCFRLGLRYPGIKLGPMTPHFGTRVILINGENRYNVELSPDENGSYPGWEKNLQYCLVMKRIPTEPEGGSVAILGSRFKWEDVDLRYECRAWVELLTEKEEADVCGEVLPEETYWGIK